QFRCGRAVAISYLITKVAIAVVIGPAHQTARPTHDAGYVYAARARTPGGSINSDPVFVVAAIGGVVTVRGRALLPIIVRIPECAQDEAGVGMAGAILTEDRLVVGGRQVAIIHLGKQTQVNCLVGAGIAAAIIVGV